MTHPNLRLGRGQLETLLISGSDVELMLKSFLVLGLREDIVTGQRTGYL